MNKFKTGVKVVVIGDNNEIRHGTIDTVYEENGYATVKFNDGTLEKVLFKDMGIDIQSETVEEPKTETTESVKYISRDEFEDALAYVTSPEGILGDRAKEMSPDKLMILGMTATYAGLSLMRKLYGDNDILAITKDDLEKATSEHCTPTSLADTVGGEMSPSQLLPIACTSLLVLKKLVSVLFKESDNE